MKRFAAIFKQTIRAAVRSRVFHVLFILILISVIGLPLTIKGDNTAAGLVQISLTYALNVVIALISASTLWLSCAQLASEIEGYNIHLAVSKPCPRYIIWLGKFCGVFVMHALLLVISMFIIYGLTQYRLSNALKNGLFTKEDIAKLNQETLVGRRQFHPVPVNLGKIVMEEYDKRVRDGRINPKDDKEKVLEQLKQEMIQQVMRHITIGPGKNHTWKYDNVQLPSNGTPLYLRFRMYSGDISSTDQRILPVDFGFGVYQDEKGNATPRTGNAVPQIWYSSLRGKPFNMPGGTRQELSTVPMDATQLTEVNIPVRADMVVDKDTNSVTLLFKNYSSQMLPDEKTLPKDNAEVMGEYNKLKKKYTALFQVVDGPILLCRVASFFNNYMRTMLMALFQIAFLAGLGSTVGAVFSTPVAVFVAISYIVIGLVVPAAVNAPLTGSDGKPQYKNTYEKVTHHIAKGVQTLVVTVDDLDCTSDLANGRLVEMRTVHSTFWKVLVFRTGIIALLGIYLLQRRELGLVVRKNT